MSHDIDRTCTIFIVDTGSYSGNFEREMVAYMTGCTGECEVGDDLAELANAEWRKAQSLPEEDDAGIQEDEDTEDDPVDGDDEDDLEDEDAFDEDDDDGIFGLPVPLQFDGDGCSRPATIWPTEGWVNDGYGNFSKSDGPGYGAYMSVAVAFDDLSAEQIKTLTERARYFCENYPKISKRSYNQTIPFTGIRVVRRVVVTTDTTLHVEKV